MTRYKRHSLDIGVIWCCVLWWMLAGVAPAIAAPNGSVSGSPARLPATTATIQNPALEKFNHAITLYASFDLTSPVADLSGGEGKPRDRAIQIEQKPGLAGQAFLTGRKEVGYDAAGNVDLSRPGSLAVWISPFEWKRDLEETPYIFFVNVHDQGRQLMLARMGDKRNGEAIYAYTQVGGAGFSIIEANSLNWKDGQWHLLVVNWRIDSVEFSVDGSPPQRKHAPGFASARGERGWLAAGQPQGDPRQLCLLDELMVLNRPLAGDEIKWIYERAKPKEGTR